MTEPRPSHLADSELPIPAQYFELYSRFWDVASLLIFSLAAIAVLITNANELTWREWMVAALSTGQALLYFFCITRGGWPISSRNLALYFVGPIILRFSGVSDPVHWNYILLLPLSLLIILIGFEIIKLMERQKKH